MLGINMGKPPGAPGASSASAEDVLAVYESLLAATQVMLLQARAGDWDSLLEGESQYLVEVEALARMEQAAQFDESQQARKAELLETILENDVRVRNYLVARRKELGEMIGASQRKRNLNRAYTPARPVIDKADGPADDH